MNRLFRLVIFLFVTALVLLSLFLVLAAFIPHEEALKITVVMVLPALWATRLLLAYRRGWITRRLNFRRSSFAITDPRILNRRNAFWRFHGYFLKEAIFCGFLWVLMLGNMVPPRFVPDMEPAPRATEPPMPIPKISAAEADIPTFRAVRHVPMERHRVSASVFDFSAEGPVAGTGFPAETGTYPLKQIAVDPEDRTIYGITTHRFGEVDPETGGFEEIPVSEDLPELSWPSGIALDPKRRILILLGRGDNFVFFPDAWAWRRLSGLERLGFRAVVYDAFRGLLVEPVGKGIKTLVTFSDQGAVMERKELSPPIPFDSYSDPPVQMIAAGEKLLVLISAHFARNRSGEERLADARLFWVDVERGAVLEVVEDEPEEDTEPEVGFSPTPADQSDGE
ncbi:MAG: hypothetical protein ACLFN9_14070 [Desulfococcaceae bacterium]